jgi:hypothetical protein
MSTAMVDLRGFVYPLDAILRKQEWEFSRLQASLLKASERLRAMQDRCQLMQEQQHSQKLAIEAALASRFDPFSYQRSLAYLVQSQLLLVSAQSQLQILREECDSLRRECVAQGVRMQMLETHRDLAVRDHVAAEQTRQINEMDRDWCTRSVWLQKTTQGMAQTRCRGGDV